MLILKVFVSALTPAYAADVGYFLTPHIVHFTVERSQSTARFDGEATDFSYQLFWTCIHIYQRTFDILSRRIYTSRISSITATNAPFPALPRCKFVSCILIYLYQEIF
jgi:hypothetical protein